MTPTHPFIGDLSNLSLEELAEKINDLHKKLAFAIRTGRYDMSNQIQMVMASYRTELDRQQRELFDATESTIKGKIDIS
jgi:BMFP domain-containing protein YqiC